MNHRHTLDFGALRKTLLMISVGENTNYRFC